MKLKETNLGLGQKLMSESKFYMGYSRWMEAQGAYETWDQSVARVLQMHREKFADKWNPELEALLTKAGKAYDNQTILGAQRALQFGGAQLRKHEARMYNCSSSHVDRTAFFQEAMYLLLCGCGVGFSVQSHHIAKLPKLEARSPEKLKVFQVPDTIEGWADAFGVLLSTYFADGGTFPEYKGYRVVFDLSLIRPAGSMISGGFKAPGPEPLRIALQKCEELLERVMLGQTRVAMRPIVAYDFVMFMADAVLAGGVRRSATICMFSKTDKEMLAAKTGEWYIDNPQRGRSNNSVVLKRDELTRQEWADIMESVKSFGEPGFLFVDNLEFAFNPCVEIGMLPVAANGETGFQFCNLVEINGGQCSSEEKFYRACEAGAILGTLQAGYTDFKYVSAATRSITEREALLGVSITGWMNNPDVLFDERILAKGAQIVKDTNRKVAALIGINVSARTTCAKPSGNASVLLKTASGIHGEHAPRYFRNVQMNDMDEVAKLFIERNPKMVERSVGSGANDIIVSFPVVSKATSIYKSDLLGVKQLDFVKKAQQFWVENGTNVELCVDKNLRHNISNTITVDDWAEVEQYIYDNRQWFAGISLLAASGDKAYAQAPFTEVLTVDQIVEAYGAASMFASGLIVDGMHAYADNLWAATAAAMGFGKETESGLKAKSDDSASFAAKLSEKVPDPLRRDWIRRMHKFANNYFDGSLQQAEFCLKDVHNLHRWESIQKSIVALNFAAELKTKKAVDASSLGAQACAGGVCEVVF